LAIYLSAGTLVVIAFASYNYLSALNKRHEVDTPAEVLKRNGYLEIRPATSLGGPGTLITIDLRTDDFVMLHPTCNMDWTEVSELWQSSRSADTSVARELNGEFKLAAEILGRTGLNVSADAITEIDIKFENTRVVLLTDESRFSLREKYLKGNCLNTALQVISVDRKCVTQPISAMQADVDYRVRFSNKIAAAERAKILDHVSGALATDGRTDTSDSIVAKGLFIGLKLDTWCVVPNNGEPGASVASLPVTKASVVINPTDPSWKEGRD
jgi:hypothetical protein